MFTVLQAVLRTRKYLKDNSETVWTTNDIKDFINEGLMHIKRQIPEYFTDLIKVYGDNDVINLDDEYEDMPCIYAASRCFEQDEQHYRATTKRNEFESALLDMDSQIRGSLKYHDKINDPSNPYYSMNDADFVKDVYYRNSSEDEIPPLNP